MTSPPTQPSHLRPTRAEIDLGAVVANYRALQRLVGPHVRVLAVIKAAAYGHGMVKVARALEDAGVFGFGVALAEEGLELRAASIQAEILVLNGVFGRAHREALSATLSPVVYDLDTVRAFSEAAAGPFDVHLKVDTGMSRLGVRWDRLDSFLASLGDVPGVRLRGVMTHLAGADTDEIFTRLQLKRFDDAVERVRSAGHQPTWIHAANSAGCLWPEARYDLVRPGISLFGVAPAGPTAPGGLALLPPMRLRSEVIATRTLQAGDPVGYDSTWRAPEAGRRIATVPIGYGDGLLWATQAGRRSGEVLIRGRRCPIVGRVSMDLTTVDVTVAELLGGEIHPGEEVVLLGGQGDERLTPESLAAAAGTIPYEILTSISSRVPRRFIEGGRLPPG